MSEFEGRCLCGAVTFSITPPTIFLGHCHCHYCQEAHGAAFVSWVGAAEERFRLSAGSREPRWTHLLLGEPVLPTAASAEPSATQGQSPLAERVASLEAEVASLNEQFEEFRKQFQ